MSKKTFYVLLGAVFVILFSLVSSAGGSSYRKATYLKNNCNNTTVGVVTSEHGSYWPVISSNVNAEFIVDGEAYTAKGIDSEKHSVDDIVEIHYNRFDPSESYAGSRPSRMNVVVFLGSYAVCWPGIIICLVRAVKEAKKEREQYVQR